MEIQAGKKYYVRDGRVATVLATDVKAGSFPIFGFIEDANSLSTSFCWWTERGTYYLLRDPSDNDLVDEHEGIVFQEGQCYLTRSGNKARLLSVRGDPDYPLVGLVTHIDRTYDEYEVSEVWDRDGFIDGKDQPNDYDLVARYE